LPNVNNLATNSIKLADSPSNVTFALEAKFRLSTAYLQTYFHPYHPLDWFDIVSKGKRAWDDFNHKSPHILREETVCFALEHSIKGLFSLSKKPKHSPNAISESMRQYIFPLKKNYPKISAETIKNLENVPVRSKTMRKIWKEVGLSS